jgi:hypothetical protein
MEKKTVKFGLIILLLTLTSAAASPQQKLFAMAG